MPTYKCENCGMPCYIIMDSVGKDESTFKTCVLDNSENADWNIVK